ncbi:MAG: NAD(P)-dependent oxidoreductase [Deltaproteobacteria bacterium HGW-Deltaproteobacteria-14]|jgi:3-hydroxyisobutyrate dehydrogenase|nr:MAG: NAD(P)-dependent oxidoreductase [Deltaproteobacteria bacterium HGW-Deltaproteobacteria-14]
MTRIAFLGLGLMGRRMARRLVAAGHDVVVWSRSGVPEDAPELRARAAASPRAAAAQADVVIAILSDDGASAAVWDDPESGALAGLRPGAVAIESSTLSPARVTALGERVRAVGAHFLDAPVVGSLPQAEAGVLVFLAGGDPAVVDGVRDLLGVMGGAVHSVGPTPAGAVTKLIVNTLLGTQIALFGELLGFAGRAGLDPAATLEVLGALAVTSPVAKGMAGLMVAKDHAPRFKVSLMEKDVRYAAEAAAAVGASLPIAERVAELYRGAIAAGDGDANLTAIARRYEP